jgi:hypothetical protein
MNTVEWNENESSTVLKNLQWTYWTQALRKNVIIVAVYLFTFIEEMLEW